MMARKSTRKAKGFGVRLSKRRLRELIEEATLDAWGDSEQAVGWMTMIEDNVGFPFETELLGVTVVVNGVDVTDRDELVAVCRRGKHRQTIPLADLPTPLLSPVGAEWIEAYRLWRDGSA